MSYGTVSPEAQAIRLHLLATGFLYPGEAQRTLLAAGLAADEAAAPIAAALQRMALIDQQVEHSRLFGSAAVCPLDLALHLSANPFAQAQAMAEMNGFYHAFAADVPAGLRPDNAGVALAFLAYLRVKEAYAAEQGLDDALAVTTAAAADFAREFLLPGLEVFCRRLRQQAHESFFVELAELARQEAARAAAGVAHSPEEVKP